MIVEMGHTVCDAICMGLLGKEHRIDELLDRN